ncbi:MAG: sulfatase-like hydrolase/transferase [Bacteroidia bacterium]|nr:sulfatase-like hydrolase/transferase [Bacteroidia bacterium]
MNSHNIPLLLIIFLLFFSYSCQQKAAPEELPNIVLLIGDDQGYPYFGFMGADYVQTPHMDQLARSGLLFKYGYVPDNHCRPSLATLMTGIQPVEYQNRVEELLVEKGIKEEERKEFEQHAMQYFETLPKLLAQKGYKSFQGGKWWEYNYQNGGFTHGMTKGWTPEDQKQGDKRSNQLMGGEGLDLARVTMQPIYDFITENKDDPFFIWYAPQLPHYPFDAPDKYYNIYKNKDMSESAKRYYANCTWFDEGVGELQMFLRKQGEFKNTLFIYVNDNGWEQDPDQEFRHDSLRWHKGGDKGKTALHDQSFRTPIIFSWYGKINPGGISRALIHSADIPATILDYVGIKPPENYFGTSYRSLLNGTHGNMRVSIAGRVNVMRSEEDMMGKQIEGYWYKNRDGWFYSTNLTTGEKLLLAAWGGRATQTNQVKARPDLVAKFEEEIAGWKRRYVK